jgi:hypothetical protein
LDEVVREDAADIGSGGFVMAVVDKTDYASCTGIGHGKTYAMSESALGSWRSRSGLNGRPQSEGRQHLFHDEMPRAALWAQGYVLTGQPLGQFLPGFPFLRGLEDLTKPVGAAEAGVPRGYLIPADLDVLADKLRAHNVKVEVPAKAVKAAGEEFVVDSLVKARRGGFAMTSLEGGFARSQIKEFPAGTFRVDLAQPLANPAF